MSNKQNVLGSIWAKVMGNTTKTVVVGSTGPEAKVEWLGVGFALIGEKGSTRKRLNIHPEQRAKKFIAHDVALFATSEAEATAIAKVNDLSRESRPENGHTRPMKIARVLEGELSLPETKQDKEIIAECQRLIAAGIDTLHVGVRVKFDMKRTAGYKKVELIFKETMLDATSHRTAWYGVKGNYVPKHHIKRKSGDNQLGFYWELEVVEVVAATPFIHQKTRFADPYGDAPIVMARGKQTGSRVTAGNDAAEETDAALKARQAIFADLAE